MFCLINLMRYFPWLINIDRYYIITQTTNSPHTAICFYCLCKEAALRGRGGEGGGVVMVDIRSGLLPVLALLSLSVLPVLLVLSVFLSLSCLQLLIILCKELKVRITKRNLHFVLAPAQAAVKFTDYTNVFFLPDLWSEGARGGRGDRGG